MAASEIINGLIQQSGMLKKDIATKMGWRSTQNLTNRLGRNTVSADEFFRIMEIIGYTVKIEKKTDTDVVEVKPMKRGVGKRLKLMVNRVKYDTFNADAICHTDETKDTFIELYQNRDGSYFVAQYVNWDGGVSSISPIGEDDAKRLYAEIVGE